MLFLGLLLFILLIVAHEFGHFIAAKLNGVDVEEFGIGFPPKIKGKHLGKGFWKAYYTINLLPLGGFVRLKGENEADKQPGSYGSAPFKSKLKITLAGVLTNYLIAVGLISIVAAIRLPVLIDHQFSLDSKVLRHDVTAANVADDSAAARAGILAGDVIKRIDNTEIESSDQLVALTPGLAGRAVRIEVISSDNSIRDLIVELPKEPVAGGGYLGVAPRDITEQRSTWSAPIVGFVVTNQLALEAVRLLGQTLLELIKGQASMASAGVTGPVGIVVIFRHVNSFVQMLLLTGLISLSLAIMNALPIPALDGGRIALSAIFKILKKPLSPKVENAVHTTGFVLLMGLVILITVSDVKRFF